jgi:hypothetical protein
MQPGDWKYTSKDIMHLSLLCPPPELQRDLSSVINSAVGIGLECSAPKVKTYQNPQVLELKPGTFHGGGLYPFQLRTARFIVPSIFTKIRWCRRCLTPEEVLHVCNVGDTLQETFTPTQKVKFCLDTFFLLCKVVLKVLEVVTSSLNLNSPPCPVQTNQPTAGSRKAVTCIFRNCARSTSCTHRNSTYTFSTC